MLLAHAALLSEARSYIAALADNAKTLEASSAYDLALIELDLVHGDDAFALDATKPAVGRDALMALAIAAVERLTTYGVDALHSRTPAGLARGRPRAGHALMYGENGALLRAELSALLAQHRVQLRLGGGGSHSVPVTTSRAEREEIGKQIRRYRQSVLVWCQQASRAVAPYASSNLSPAAPTPFRLPPTQHGGLASLRLALDHTVDTSSARLPELHELVAPQELPLVEHWRQAARGAALGEHDFAAGLHHESLDVPQVHTLVGDIAAVVRALVILDQRYRSIPGWERLHRAERLGWSALACALDSSLEPPSYAIDALGWRAPTNVMPGPARPGLLGVLQAERNLAVRLRPLPSAINLRRIVHSQQVLSGGIAELAANIDTGLRDQCLTRQQTYADLQRELRDVGSLIGTGELAVADSADVIGRLRALRPDVDRDLRVLRAFTTLFDKIDTQIAEPHRDRHRAQRLPASGHTSPPRRRQRPTRRPRSRAVHTVQRCGTQHHDGPGP